ncbi:MAG: prolyl oligopeptidase family serine peptidase, partial [Acidobacteriota bacterium]
MAACSPRGVVLLAMSACLLAAQSLVVPTDLYRIRTITSLDLAHDGSKAVFAVRSIDGEEYRSRLYSIDLTRPAAPVPLTGADRSDSNPAISPNGQWLAFVRRDPAPRGRPQIWLMPLDTPGEPRMLTDLEFGVAEFTWRPDSKALLASSNLPLSKIAGKPPFPSERPARDWNDVPKDTKPNPDGSLDELRAWLSANAAKDNPTLVNRLAFQDEEALRHEMSIPNLFAVEIDSGAVKPLAHGFEPRQNFTYSPDGLRIAYVSVPDFSTHPDRFGSFDWRRSTLFEMQAGGSGRKTILAGNLGAGSPRYSEDGRYLYVLTHRLEKSYASNAELIRISTGGGASVAGRWAASIGSFTPLPGGDALIGGAWHGGFPLLREEFNGADPKPVIDTPAGVQLFESAAGRTVYALTTVDDPSALYVLEGNAAPRRLTNLNTEWLSRRTLAKPEEHWITRPDGTRVQMWIMKPVGFREGVKTPWVLDMHGGPAAMWGPGEPSMWHEFQLFCSRGYGVVYANPRGSGGYGEQFQAANFRDWGAGPAGDVLAALDHAMEFVPEIDKDQLFLTGGSYAGYLTA